MPGFRGLSHLTPAGEARMVDVSAKAETVREAVARVTLKMKAGHPRRGARRPARQGRRARGGAHRRDHGGQAHARPDSALPPAAHHRRATSSFALDSRRSTITVRGARAHGGQDRRGDGSADRRRGGRPHRVRHGQGGGHGASCSPTSASSRSPAASPALGEQWLGERSRGERRTWRADAVKTALDLIPTSGAASTTAPSTRSAWSGSGSRGGSWRPTASPRCRAPRC